MLHSLAMNLLPAFSQKMVCILRASDHLSPAAAAARIDYPNPVTCIGLLYCSLILWNCLWIGTGDFSFSINRNHTTFILLNPVHPRNILLQSPVVVYRNESSINITMGLPCHLLRVEGQ